MHCTICVYIFSIYSRFAYYTIRPPVMLLERDFNDTLRARVAIIRCCCSLAALEYYECLVLHLIIMFSHKRSLLVVFEAFVSLRLRFMQNST